MAEMVKFEVRLWTPICQKKSTPSTVLIYTFSMPENKFSKQIVQQRSIPKLLTILVFCSFSCTKMTSLLYKMAHQEGQKIELREMVILPPGSKD